MRRVGRGVLGVLAAVVAFYALGGGQIEWGARTHVRVHFHHVGPLREGAAFVVAGRQVGRVDAIAVAAIDGATETVASVAIRPDVAARLDPHGDVFVASRGMLGERYLEIAPGSGADALGLHDGDELVGRDPPDLDRAIQRTWDNMAAFRGVTEDLAPELAALRAQIRALEALLDPASPTALPHAAELATLALALGALSDQVQTLRARGLGGDAGLGKLADLLDRTRAFVADARGKLALLDHSMTALRAGFAAAGARLDANGQGVVADADRALAAVQSDIAKVDPLLANVAGLQLMIERGDGSLMKLSRDPEFPEDAKELGKIIKQHPWKLIDHPADHPNPDRPPEHP